GPLVAALLAGEVAAGLGALAGDVHHGRVAAGVERADGEVHALAAAVERGPALAHGLAGAEAHHLEGGLALLSGERAEEQGRLLAGDAAPLDVDDRGLEAGVAHQPAEHGVPEGAVGAARVPGGE